MNKRGLQSSVVMLTTITCGPSFAHAHAIDAFQLAGTVVQQMPRQHVQSYDSQLYDTLKQATRDNRKHPDHLQREHYKQLAAEENAPILQAQLDSVAASAKQAKDAVEEQQRLESDPVYAEKIRKEKEDVILKQHEEEEAVLAVKREQEAKAAAKIQEEKDLQTAKVANFKAVARRHVEAIDAESAKSPPAESNELSLATSQHVSGYSAGVGQGLRITYKGNYPVRIKTIVINKGNCKPDFSPIRAKANKFDMNYDADETRVQKYTEVTNNILRFGSVWEIASDCGIILEVNLQTTRGDLTYTFGD